MEYREKRKNVEPEVPCSVCGGNEFEWGILNGGWYAKSFMSFSYKMIRVRRCLNCNNLLQFIDEERSRQYMMMIIVLVIIVVIGALMFSQSFIS